MKQWYALYVLLCSYKDDSRLSVVLAHLFSAPIDLFHNIFSPSREKPEHYKLAQEF